MQVQGRNEETALGGWVLLLSLLVATINFSGCGALAGALGGGPKTTIAFKNTITTLGAGQAYQFQAVLQHDQGKGATFTLSGGGTLVQESSNFAWYIAPATPPSGEVSVTATAANGSGVFVTDSFTITAAPGPVVTITPGSFTASGGGSPVTLDISVTQDNASDTLSGGVSGNWGSLGSFVGTPGGGSYTVQYFPPSHVPSGTPPQQVQVFSSLANSTVGTAIVTLNAGGGGGGSNAICKPQGSESLLSGLWGFGISGLGTDHVDLRAAFVADGSGGITSGTEDVGIPSSALQSLTVDPSSSNTGSSYSLDSTGYGCLALVSTSGTAVSKTFHMIMDVKNGAMDYNYGRIMEFDGSARGVGQLQPGNSSASNASLNGTSIFSLSGWDTAGHRVGVAGSIIFDGNGGINTTANGLGDTDAYNDVGTRLPIAAGSYSVAADGRGTISFTVGDIPINGVIYVGATGGCSILSYSTSQTNASLSYLLSGSASELPGTLTNSLISGYQLVTESGSDGVAIGILNLTSSGGLSGTLWLNRGGTASTQSLTGSYTITEPNYGRVTFSISGVNYPPIVYMTGSTNGFDGDLVGSGGNGDTGTTIFQSATAPNFSPSGFTTDIFNQHENAGTGLSGYTTRIGRITFDGVSTFSGTYDESGPNGLTTNNPISGSYTVNPDGSGTFEQGTWPMVMISDWAWYIDENSTNVQPSVDVMRTQ
jgi:hypothetical protein